MKFQNLNTVVAIGGSSSSQTGAQAIGTTIGSTPSIPLRAVSNTLAQSANDQSKSSGSNIPIKSKHCSGGNAAGINLKDQLFVFLAVSRGDDHRLAQLPVHGLEDDCFFELLKEEYLRVRGLIRRLLSIYIYHHCNFMMVSPPTFEHPFHQNTE
jgi:hypothetical protein